MPIDEQSGKAPALRTSRCPRLVLHLVGWAVCWIGSTGRVLADPVAGGCAEYAPVTVTAGFGRTFRFWYLLDGAVVPLTVTWSCDRYELGLFYFGDQFEHRYGTQVLDVQQDYAVSLSRRWVVHRWGSLGLFFGVGGSYRTRAGPNEGNFFDGSHLNFAEQMGLRWMSSHEPRGIELSIRHFSNAGIVTPNVGQNFVDLALVF